MSKEKTKAIHPDTFHLPFSGGMPGMFPEVGTHEMEDHDKEHPFHNPVNRLSSNEGKKPKAKRAKAPKAVKTTKKAKNKRGK